MTSVPIATAQADLEHFVALAEAGEEIVLTRQDKPAVRLVPLRAVETAKRRPGAWWDRLPVPHDIFDPLPDDELRHWED